MQEKIVQLIFEYEETGDGFFIGDLVTYESANEIAGTAGGLTTHEFDVFGAMMRAEVQRLLSAVYGTNIYAAKYFVANTQEEGN